MGRERGRVAASDGHMAGNLDLLLSDGILDEILGRLKSGKEAEVFLVRYRGEVVAAKVYKDRQQRSFKNNAAYTEGRQVRNSRTRRAMEKGSRFGQGASEDAWKSAEADALYKLHAHGVRVPTPVLFYEGVLLMQLVLDEEGEPAPRLIDAPLDPAAAGPIYRDIRKQIIGMLCCELIHGDLSPYNILIGVDGPTIIDFPQVISPSHNTQSDVFFRRDFENILHFLGGLDRSLLAQASDGREIWQAYVRRELTPEFVPRGRARPEHPFPVPGHERSPRPSRSRPHYGPDPRRPEPAPPPGRGSPGGAPPSPPQGGRQGEREPQGARSFPQGGRSSPQGARPGEPREALPSLEPRWPRQTETSPPRHEQAPGGGPQRAQDPLGSAGSDSSRGRPPTPVQARSGRRSSEAPVEVYLRRSVPPPPAPTGERGPPPAPTPTDPRWPEGAPPRRRRR